MKITCANTFLVCVIYFKSFPPPEKRAMVSHGRAQVSEPASPSTCDAGAVSLSEAPVPSSALVAHLRE